MGPLALMAVCTDLGPLVGSVDEAGALEGTVATRFSASGTTAEVVIRDGGTVLYRGPLDALNPVEGEDCGPGGATSVRVGGWPEALPLGAGRQATWADASQVRVRGPEGQATVYLSLPMDRALAASVAAELAAALPDARTAVAWKAGRALLCWSWDAGQPLPEGIAAVPGETPVIALLDLQVPSAPPAPGPGGEAVAYVNDVRAAAGFPALRWDEALARQANPHRGEPLSPREAVDAWLASPYVRDDLLHPGGGRVGVAEAGGAWAVRVQVADDAATGAWPARGETVPATSFVAREDPDPLSLGRYPDRVWPVGFPITVWTPDRVRASSITCDGDDVPHWIARAPLGERDHSRHLVPKTPLQPGATCTWTARSEQTVWSGSFVAPADPLDVEVPLPPAVAAVVRRANDGRAVPLRATARAAARARLTSARTRAMAEGLDPADLRGVVAPVQLCIRPGDTFDLDESLLDPRYTEVGADDRATTVTWRSDPAPRASLQSPRTCLYLYSSR